MGDTSKGEESGGRGGSGSSGTDEPKASNDNKRKSSSQMQNSKSGDSGGSNTAGEKGAGGNSSQNSNNDKNVDGVLSQTLDENSNEWRNGSGNGLSGNSQGGGTDGGHFEPSTSFAEEDDDGVRPGDLYGKFTWKIENFSEISKRELRSNVFEVGEYKWYILVYPQGCDVSNHLSLFLCVADYDKLLPGWSHFAQFTIAVVNKDPKKSKYSDTLHRFCKKEHDWGWKKFMELSKVLDGFTVSDTLVIKAQVQVIREKQNRPFRCLDTQYRRELVRVYLTNVEGICRRFLEERREKLAKLRECPESFHEFWDSLSVQLRSCLASDRADNILKSLVKRFFNEKEVTSTLVMDALHSGYKALQVEQGQKTLAAAPAPAAAKGKGDKADKGSKGSGKGGSSAAAFKTLNASPSDPPVSISMEENLTYLAGDVMKTLEQAANEAVPPHNEDKDLDDYGKDSLERDERRLAELGKQAIEMFVVSHLYTNRIEVAFKENEALKRQEALIREEEEAERLESERQLKKQEAERERRNRRKEKKQRKKEKKEAEEAAAEAERLKAEEEKKKKEEEAKKAREEALEKERQQREQEREAARQLAKEKEAAKKAAKKAALQKEEALRQKQQAEAAAAAQQQQAAAAKEKERLAAEEKEKEKKLRQQQQQQQKKQQASEERQSSTTEKGASLQEKDKVISELAKKVEGLEMQLAQKDGTIAKLQSQLKQTVEVLQHMKERSNDWQQVVPGSAPSTPEQQKHVPNVDYHQQRSPPQSAGSPGTAGVEASGVPLAQDASQPHGMVSPMKSYTASAANQRVFSSIPKGYQGSAGNIQNGGHPARTAMGNMPSGHIPQVPNGMSAYAQHPAGAQPQGMAGEKGAPAMVNGKASEQYGHGSHMMMQGGYRLAPVGQPVPGHAGGHGQDQNSGLDDFAHMGLITDLLD
ncbi:MATH domain-containing protein [Chloropicon primus]|uniref:MATH domain-containing protein n=1 Tax=Chloropicon primus TaxID=1764295 RepID=A0A5B8MDA4_9CHLO|nr:MATH domain-containing protein [Chloropicon primus]UPQ97777.1 MATH domain-containing protein [Chloropicon primus]|mmetsp:Transcript_13249/g.37138  ORF Transcript_13249/g.37138 Transcript_13249/m.37138 type:complete len:928 (-) Transcript_13249:1933-4716(-)|eukprot:QDZ18568.1 MATH domain-containing protein [Chloropicon primus]